MPDGVDSFVLAVELAEIARALHAAGDARATEHAITGLAVKFIAACDHAGITVLRKRGRIASRGGTDGVASALDELQRTTRQGPCVDSTAKEPSYRVEDLRTDPRWPAFSHRAVELTGVRSIVAFRLFVDGGTIGALNLYADRPGAFPENGVAIRRAELFAVHASTALQASMRAENLEVALGTRETISVAVGILMARQRCTRQAAFEMLRRASQRRNAKLRDIAAQITGDEFTAEAILGTGPVD